MAESGELRRKGEWWKLEKERPVGGKKLLQSEKRSTRLLCPRDGTNKPTDHADGWNGLEWGSKGAWKSKWLAAFQDLAGRAERRHASAKRAKGR